MRGSRRGRLPSVFMRDPRLTGRRVESWRSEELTVIRRFAARVLNATIRRARPDVRGWAQAMLREMDFIESDWSALSWAIGSVRSVRSASRWKGRGEMNGERINRVSGRIVTGLSALALLTVISGYFQAPQTDEGTAAHIFQLSIVLLSPMILLFLVSADWKKPLRSARTLAFPAAVLLAAFAALYYLEHYRWALSR